jgi:hypothetical protein
MGIGLKMTTALCLFYTQTNWFCAKRTVKSFKIQAINQKNPENYFNLGLKLMTKALGSNLL